MGANQTYRPRTASRWVQFKGGEICQPIDMTTRIKRRQVVHGLISEYRRAG
jgi:hypothetical protein